MLVLKKQLTTTKYEVLDTDDNSVEVATTQELYHCVKDLGMQIQGVSITGNNAILFKPQFDYSVKETKFKVFKGIDMHVENGELVKFTYTEDLRDTTLKLSDYCHTIVPHCFQVAWNVKTGGNHVTLVLDDSLDIKSGSFIDFFYCGVVNVDVSALSDKKADYVYKEAIKAEAIGLYQSRGYKSVIDTNEKRFYYYWAECILKDGLFAFNGQVSRAEEVIPFVDEYTKMLQRKYKQQFEKLANSMISFNESYANDATKRVNIINNFKLNLQNANSVADRNKLYLKLCRTVLSSSCSNITVSRLYNLITLFKPDDYYKELWNRLCNNILDFIARY